MINPLQHPVFRYLFASQILSLLGIGVMTVALTLRAADMVGVAAAGQLLGWLFALKMVVYVLLAPVLEAGLSRLDPRRVLIALDAVRLVLLLVLSQASEIWQLLMLTAAFYMASAAFTPLFQALIPAVLDDEALYTRALVFSRLAYTFESLASPILASLALLIISTGQLFPLAALCLGGSILALIPCKVSADARIRRKRPFRERLQRGLSIYWLTPRLRGLFALNLAMSLGLGWVLVNTVVHAGTIGQEGNAYLFLMGGYGAGSALAALSVPALLQRATERSLMIAGCMLFALLSWLILLPLPFSSLILLWAGFGAASSLTLAPGGLVLTRSAVKPDHPAVFAAQFSMSHAGWLLAYPLAGWLGATLSPVAALVVLGSACLLVSLIGARLWPAQDPLEREHRHPELPHDHPHLRESPAAGVQQVHTHVFHIDDLHLRWNP